MYTYVTTCRDVESEDIITPIYINDTRLILFETKEQAFDSAYHSALIEVEHLNMGTNDCVSFGIAEDDEFQSMNEIVVNYYYEDETEMVTTRTIIEVVSYKDIR